MCYIDNLFVIHSLLTTLIISTTLSQNLGSCDFSTQTLSNIVRIPKINRGKIPSGFQITKDLIVANGFGYEEHRMKTEDGYLIRSHRIVTKTPRGPPVLFQVGLFMASDGWMANGRKLDIVFQLADLGFDVWLADRRGNWYSREHIVYPQNSRKFWDFSFHESGYYDLPAFIDRIIKITKHRQVIFIGHSMACTEFFVMTSLRPQYNAKVKTAILLAPATQSPVIDDVKYLVLKFLLSISDNLFERFTIAGGYEMVFREAQFVDTLRKCCAPSDAQKFCLDIYGLIFGENRANFNLTTFGNVLSHLPSGSSLKTVHHMAQIYKSDFGLYDYGPDENLRRYKNTSRPLYPLENVSTPVAIYWGANDPLVNKRSITELIKKLPNVIGAHKIEDPKYGHMDFIWGLNSNSLLYRRIIKLLKRFL